MKCCLHGVVMIVLLTCRYLPFLPAQAFAHGCPAPPLPQEEKIRARSSARQHQARPQEGPLRPCSWGQPQVPCPPSRLGQLCLGKRAHYQEDPYHRCRECLSLGNVQDSVLVNFRSTTLLTTSWSERTLLSRAPSSRLMLLLSVSGTRLTYGFAIFEKRTAPNLRIF